MRPLISLCLTLACATAQAQPSPQNSPTPSPNGREVLSKSEQIDGRKAQRIEHIQVQDAGSRIDELRVGGETRRITVQSAADVPAYEMLPTDGARARPAERNGQGGTTGQRVWNILKF